MSKNSPAKYYKDIKKEYKEKLVKDIKVFLKKEKKKWEYAREKICQKMKYKSSLDIEKNIIKREKTPNYNYKEIFSNKKFTFFLKGLTS